ncbi:MAG: TIGR04076 family protein [Candidatus Hodarchaeota archaeon]
MSSGISKCKLTVLKRMFNQDLVNKYLEDAYQNLAPCDRFQDGQEFIIDENGLQEPPADFCASAWADIRKDVLMIAIGGDMPGLKNRGMTLTGCTDWFRPVIFKVERID